MKARLVTVPTQLELARQLLSYREVAAEDICNIGPIVITEVGEENIYFTSVWYGSEHYCKTNP
jgi:hypothetical protein